jgi:hypothetical protein
MNKQRRFLSRFVWQNKSRNYFFQLLHKRNFVKIFGSLLAVSFGFHTNLFAELLPVKIYTSADGLGSGVASESGDYKIEAAADRGNATYRLTVTVK